MHERTNARMHEGESARMHERGRTSPGTIVLCAFVHVGVCAFLTSGCARARAEATPSLPPLEMPVPPPRILVPLEVEAEAPQPPPVPEAPPPAPVETTPRPAPASPVEQPKSVEAPPPKPAPSGTTLQTTPTAAEGAVERAIRATMARANADLNRIDYRALDANARTQYDTARRFVQQADDAIRLRNLPFAKNLADKAAVLAAQLLGG
jgi:hypothetical protein